MARSKVKAALEGAVAVTGMNAKASMELVNQAIERAIVGAKNLVQTAEKFEPILHAAAMLCMEHANTHGDIRPAHRLVTELPTSPVMKQYQTELVSWFRANSPIYWDAKGEVHLAKEGEPQFKEFAPEKASEEAFYQRPQAVKARQAAAAAHKRSMEPASFEDLKKRIFGLRNWMKKALEPDSNGDIRGIKKGDKEKMEAAINVVESSFETFASGKTVKATKPSAVSAASKRSGKASDDSLKSEAKGGEAKAA